MKAYSNPQGLTRLKRQAYDLYVIFSHLTPDDGLFDTYMNAIDKILSRITEQEENYYPFWMKDFQSKVDEYYSPMKIKVSRTCLEPKIHTLIKAKSILKENVYLVSLDSTLCDIDLVSTEPVNITNLNLN